MLLKDLIKIMEQDFHHWKMRKNNFEFTQNCATIVWLSTMYKMETEKIVNLLVDADDESSEFETSKW